MAKRIIEKPANTAFKFRIYPNEYQKDIIEANFRLNRDIYNYFLAEQKDIDNIILLDFFRNLYNDNNIVFEKVNENDKYKQYILNGEIIKFRNDKEKEDYKKYRNQYKTTNNLWFNVKGNKKDNVLGKYEIFNEIINNNKEKYEYVVKTCSHVRNASLEALKKAFDNMKKTHSGFPKFKSVKDSEQSYSMQIQIFNNKYKGLNITPKKTLHNAKEKFKKSRCFITIPKLSDLEIIIHREEFFLNWNKFDNLLIKSITISKNSIDNYFISFSCWYKNINTNIIPVIPDNLIGIDCNIGHITTSDINLNKDDFFNGGKLFDKYNSLLKKKERAISFKKGSKKGETKSKNYIRLRKNMNKIHNKIANKRNYNNNVISKKLVDSEYDTFVFEDLKVTEMTKRTSNQKERKNQNVKRKRSMRRNILDMGWNDLMNKVTYKAKVAGKNVEKVDPKYTSKMCDNCGYINHNLKLKDRNWTCPNCGKEHERDFTAANNIKNKFYKK